MSNLHHLIFKSRDLSKAIQVAGFKSRDLSQVNQNLTAKKERDISRALKKAF